MTDSITGTNFIAIATWFAPSPLFILVNLVIGTIALVSCFSAAPKIKIIQRAKSFNPRHYYNHQEPASSVTQPESVSESTQPLLVQTPTLLKQVVSFNLSLHKLAPVKTHYLQPDTENSSAGLNLKPISDSGDDKNKVELKRSVSEKECSMTLDWEEEEDEETLEGRRPSTAMARSETTTCKEDEGVDAKADDFINMFKKQLRLQRLNSFVRYRNTLTLPSFE
ncbi:pathogen-associated molecular patterns-induced protein A70 [Lathyrus oleraceus]|uniref:DUF4408 domain-containing protein n=1 Tax=Pisum sativum TaxID=3888 RepID=A0A9D4X5V5_PEA|nr:pathogen-associated molecular patterns-induced protein A70-like [Pisum sativum]KAI5415184.1 hypothetical protein KIW84_040582 [Pisum sativum]